MARYSWLLAQPHPCLTKVHDEASELRAGFS